MKFIFILFLAFLSISCQTKYNEHQRPNFIFYISDDQDFLDYKVYGNDLIESSGVSKIAKDGIVFTNAYTSQAICSPSRSQLFTGLNPIKNGSYANHLPVKSSVAGISKYLKEVGYDVYLSGKSHIKPDSVFDWTHYFPLKNRRYFQMGKIKNLIRYSTKPYCLFIASTFPHLPYIENDDYTIDDILKLPYEDSIPESKVGYYSNVKVDNDQFSDIIETVDSVDKNNTVLFYISDHGISGKWGIRENGLKIPLVVRWPDVIKASSKSEVLINIVDIMPTILEIAGAEIPDHLDGKSFLKTLMGNKNEINKYIFGISTRQNVRDPKIFPSRSVRDNRYKFILNFNSIDVYKNNLTINSAVNYFIEKGALSEPDIPYMELFDLEEDPFEKNNLASNKKYDEIKNHLESVLRNWMRNQKDFVGDGSVPLIKATRHPLDKISPWNKIPINIEGTLKDEDYMTSHY
ncbi:MAG: N-sulfoglucosamine sulfohydrolase [Flammeovirgaceae bacterium]|nr:N-sulfoglucosamine sulfohydrolase [Flammeovirgaceae bacterium]